MKLDETTIIPVFIIEPYKWNGQHRGNIIVKCQDKIIYGSDINLFSQKKQQELITHVSKKTGIPADQIESRFLNQLGLLLQNNQQPEKK